MCSRGVLYLSGTLGSRYIYLHLVGPIYRSRSSIGSVSHGFCGTERWDAFYCECWWMWLGEEVSRCVCSKEILGGFKHFWNVQPYLGKMNPNFDEHIFQMGGKNHQLVVVPQKFG